MARFNLSAKRPESLGFATYLGAHGGKSIANAIAIDRYGDAYVVGNSTVDVPSIAAFGNGLAPYYACGNLWLECETFVEKLDGYYGNALRPATLLRGASGISIAVDKDLNSYVTGAATSGLATTAGAFQENFAGGTDDAFVAKITASGYSLIFSTFLGGNVNEAARDIAVNNSNMPFVTGTTESPDFPLGPGAFKRDLGPGSMAASFVTALGADGHTLYYSSYLGGSINSYGGGTRGNGIALDPAWNAYVTGETSDAGFTVTPGAFQTTLTGSSDAFVAKVVIAGDLRATVFANPSSVARNGVVIYHARLTNYGPDGSDNVVFSDTIPTGMAYAGVYVPNGNGCSEPAAGATTGTLTCRKVRLESGETYYVNVYLRAAGKSGTKTTNQMRVSAQTQDLWPSNNSASAVVQIF